MDITPQASYLSIGEFEFQGNPWNQGELVEGEDFAQALELTPDDSVRISWGWPKSLPDIVSYPGFIWGQKPWSDTSTTRSLPARIADIGSLSVAYDLDWGPERLGNYNVAFDIWIASDTTEAPGVKLSELMVWVKDWDWTSDEEPLARFVDANGKASIYHRAHHGDAEAPWSYTSVVYDHDVRSGVLDLDALLEHLAGLGIVNRSHFLMDIELGAEIVNGAGWLEVDRLLIDYDGVTAELVSDAIAQFAGEAKRSEFQ